MSSSRLCGHRVSRVYHHQPVASPCDLFQSAKLWLEEPDQAVVSRVFLEGGACLSGNLCGTSCAGWVIFPDSHPVGGASVARSSSPPRVPSRGRGPVNPLRYHRGRHFQSSSLWPEGLQIKPWSSRAFLEGGGTGRPRLWTALAEATPCSRCTDQAVVRLCPSVICRTDQAVVL